MEALYLLIPLSIAVVFGAIVALPDYPGMAEKAGMRPFSANLDDIKRMSDEQVANWTAVARSLNIQPE